MFAKPPATVYFAKAPLENIAQITTLGEKLLIITEADGEISAYIKGPRTPWRRVVRFAGIDFAGGIPIRGTVNGVYRLKFKDGSEAEVSSFKGGQASPYGWTEWKGSKICITAGRRICVGAGFKVSWALAGDGYIFARGFGEDAFVAVRPMRAGMPVITARDPPVADIYFGPEKSGYIIHKGPEKWDVLVMTLGRYGINGPFAGSKIRAPKGKWRAFPNPHMLIIAEEAGRSAVKLSIIDGRIPKAPAPAFVNGISGV